MGGGKNKNVKRMLNAVVRHPRTAEVRRQTAKRAGTKAAREVKDAPAALKRGAKKHAQKEARAQAQASRFLHPEGRVAAQLRRKALAKDRKSHQQVAKDREIRRGLERPLWFREQLLKRPAEYVAADEEEIGEWVKRYIARNDARIRLLSDRRRGNPRISGLEKELSLQRAAEREEFRTGFQAPDLLTRKAVRSLRLWSGAADTARLIKMITVHSPDKPEAQPRRRTEPRPPPRPPRVPGTDVKTFTAPERQAEAGGKKRREKAMQETRARRAAIVRAKRLAGGADTDPAL
jgi:hypothetical protein